MRSGEGARRACLRPAHSAAPRPAQVAASEAAATATARYDKRAPLLLWRRRCLVDDPRQAVLGHGVPLPSDRDPQRNRDGRRRAQNADVASHLLRHRVMLVVVLTAGPNTASSISYRA